MNKSPAIIDLSHPITDKPSCSFSLADRIPKVSFEEGDAHGMFFITSHIDNLGSNVCTHIDFPGHLASLNSDDGVLTGQYPVERFIGPVLVCDVSAKMDQLLTAFSEDGSLAIEPTDGQRMLSFLQALDTAAIGASDLRRFGEQADTSLEDLRGLVFFSGASRFWQYATFDSWQYAYFYNPFLTQDACELLVNAGVSFVGIDAFQLEHPIINFVGDELPVILNTGCRRYVAEKLDQMDEFANHTGLLAADILLYENLNVPAELAGSVVDFSGVPLNLQLPDVNDNALCRPYARLPD